MKLEVLIEDLPGLTLYGDGDVDIASVEYDSRKVAKGALFVAVKGFSVDGHDFIQGAVDSGATALVVSEERSDDFIHLTEKGIALVAAKDDRQALEELAARFYGHPSEEMLVIGITGTNGKTSTTYMLESILTKGGYSCGVIGTVNYRWQGKEIPAPNTTPESRDLQYLLREMRNDGVDAVVMEVSSHALELCRVDSISFDGAIFTNLTQDHLDFHKSFEDYFAAKERLFTLLSRSSKERRIAVINSDDEYGRRLTEICGAFDYGIVTFGLERGADLVPVAGSVDNSISGISYDLPLGGKSVRIELTMGGAFHVYNSLGAVAIGHAFGISPDAICSGLKELTTVPGRFDTIASDLGFGVVVDYAHTSDALEKLLSSVGEIRKGRIITVFGCGGDRDRAKRPLMGEAASKGSDYVIVTSDNPRTEDPAQIIEDILPAMTGTYEVIQDREAAIQRAIAMAEKNDIVVIAGKGHEDYQILGTEKIHFDDREIARKFMKEREGK